MERKASQALVGKRIRLVRCHDVFSSLRAQTEGTVISVDDMGTVHTLWDTGQTLGLVWEAGDRWHICNKQVNKTSK